MKNYLLDQLKIFKGFHQKKQRTKRNHKKRSGSMNTTDQYKRLINAYLKILMITWIIIKHFLLCLHQRYSSLLTPSIILNLLSAIPSTKVSIQVLIHPKLEMNFHLLSRSNSIRSKKEKINIKVQISNQRSKN